MRLAVLSDVNHVIARYGVDGYRRNGHVDRQSVINRRRVARLVADARRHGDAAVAECRQIRRRNAQRPAAVRACGCGVVFAVQRHGHGLARFGGGGAGYGQIGLRFSGIQNIVGRQGIDGHGRRGRIHAVLAARRGAVAVHVGDAHLYAGVAILKVCQIRRRYGVSPVTAVVHCRAIDFAVQADGHGLPGFHVGGRTGQHQISALLRRVNHVVGGDGIDADGNGRQIYRHVVADGNRVARRAVAGNADFDGAFRPCAHVGGRDRRAPGAVRQHCSRIVFTVDGDGQRRARRQPVAGTGDDQVLRVLDGVDHVITRDGVDAQARQVSVDSDLALAGAGVAVAVGDGRRHTQAAVAQRGQHVRRHVHGPGQIVLHRRGVAVAAKGDGDGIARFGIRHGAAQGLTCRHFRRVDDVIARHGVDGDGRQRGVHQQVRDVAHAVAHAVGGGRIQGVIGLTETGQIRCRNGQAPGAVCRSRRRVVFTVEVHGHYGAFREVSAGAADAQILAFFNGIQDVVIADGVEADRRQTGIDGHVMRAGAGIARRVGD